MRRRKLYDQFEQLYVEGFVQFVDYQSQTMLIKFPALLEIHELPFSYHRVKGIFFKDLPSNPKLLSLDMYMEKKLRSAIPKIKFDFDMRAQYACSSVKTIGEINHINIEGINRNSPAAQERLFF